MLTRIDSLNVLSVLYQNSFLDIIHSVVILLQHCLGSGEFQVLFAAFTPWDRCEPIQVIPCNTSRYKQKPKISFPKITTDGVARKERKQARDSKVHASE